MGQETMGLKPCELIYESIEHQELSPGWLEQQYEKHNAYVRAKVPKDPGPRHGPGGSATVVAVVLVLPCHTNGNIEWFWHGKPWRTGPCVLVHKPKCQCWCCAGTLFFCAAEAIAYNSFACQVAPSSSTYKMQWFLPREQSQLWEGPPRSPSKDRLLEFSVQDGWQPLCDFLGIVDLPSMAFPHVNDSASMQRVGMVVQVIVYGWLPGTLLLILLIWKCWNCCCASRGILKSRDKKEWAQFVCEITHLNVNHFVVALVFARDTIRFEASLMFGGVS